MQENYANQPVRAVRRVSALQKERAVCPRWQRGKEARWRSTFSPHRKETSRESFHKFIAKDNISRDQNTKTIRFLRTLRTLEGLILIEILDIEIIELLPRELNDIKIIRNRHYTQKI